MPNFRCACDEVIDLSPIPSGHEWLAIKESDVDRWTAARWNRDHQAERETARHMLECPHCGRLYFWTEGRGMNGPAIVYKPDDLILPEE